MRIDLAAKHLGELALAARHVEQRYTPRGGGGGEQIDIRIRPLLPGIQGALCRRKDLSNSIELSRTSEATAGRGGIPVFYRHCRFAGSIAEPPVIPH